MSLDKQRTRRIEKVERRIVADVAGSEAFEELSDWYQKEYEEVLAGSALEDNQVITPNLVYTNDQDQNLASATPYAHTDLLNVRKDNPLVVHEKFTLINNALGLRVAFASTKEVNGRNQYQNALTVESGWNGSYWYVIQNGSIIDRGHIAHEPLALNQEAEMFLIYNGESVSYRLEQNNEVVVDADFSSSHFSKNVHFLDGNIRWDQGQETIKRSEVHAYHGHTIEQIAEAVAESNLAAEDEIEDAVRLSSASSILSSEEDSEELQLETRSVEEEFPPLPTIDMSPEERMAAWNTRVAAMNEEVARLTSLMNEESDEGLKQEYADRIQEIELLCIAYDAMEVHASGSGFTIDYQIKSDSAYIELDGVEMTDDRIIIGPTGSVRFDTAVQSGYDRSGGVTIKLWDSPQKNTLLDQIGGHYDRNSHKTSVYTGQALGIETGRIVENPIEHSLGVIGIQGPTIVMSFSCPGDGGTVQMEGGGLMYMTSFEKEGGTAFDTAFLTINTDLPSGNYAITLRNSHNIVCTTVNVFWNKGAQTLTLLDDNDWYTEVISGDDMLEVQQLETLLEEISQINDISINILQNREFRMSSKLWNESNYYKSNQELLDTYFPESHSLRSHPDGGAIYQEKMDHFRSTIGNLLRIGVDCIFDIWQGKSQEEAKQVFFAAYQREEMMKLYREGVVTFGMSLPPAEELFEEAMSMAQDYVSDQLQNQRDVVAELQQQARNAGKRPPRKVSEDAVGHNMEVIIEAHGGNTDQAIKMALSYGYSVDEAIAIAQSVTGTTVAYNDSSSSPISSEDAFFVGEGINANGALTYNLGGITRETVASASKVLSYEESGVVTSQSPQTRSEVYNQALSWYDPNKESPLQKGIVRTDTTAGRLFAGLVQKLWEARWQENAETLQLSIASTIEKLTDIPTQKIIDAIASHDGSFEENLTDLFIQAGYGSMFPSLSEEASTEASIVSAVVDKSFYSNEESIRVRFNIDTAGKDIAYVKVYDANAMPATYQSTTDTALFAGVRDALFVDVPLENIGMSAESMQLKLVAYFTDGSTVENLTQKFSMDWDGVERNSNIAQSFISNEAWFNLSDTQKAQLESALEFDFGGNEKNEKLITWLVDNYLKNGEMEFDASKMEWRGEEILNDPTTSVDDQFFGECKFWADNDVTHQALGIDLPNNANGYSWLESDAVESLIQIIGGADTLENVLSQFDIKTGDYVQMSGGIFGQNHTFIIGSITKDGAWVFDSNWLENHTPGYHFFSNTQLNSANNFTIYRLA